jgi:hypothetical protein
LPESLALLSMRYTANVTAPSFKAGNANRT